MKALAKYCVSKTKIGIEKYKYLTTVKSSLPN